MSLNLPNSLTVGRIIISPLVALLPFAPSWSLRFAAFVLFIVVAVTDYWDGKLARSRNLVTRLGTLLDPLADKLLLLATFVPMFLLAGNGWDASLISPHRTPVVDGVLGPMLRADGSGVAFPFLTPWGPVGLPWWILAIVLGRELFMTLFRQAAARRGVVIGAIGPAKVKTGFQWTWVGIAFFWFGAATLAAQERWTALPWRLFVWFNGTAGVLTMAVAVALTMWSMWLYLRRYGTVFRA
ncbi:MAG TPA: CDP-alcohol phosphatidyltransferase family protein [Gemmatimonadaceae bacterium]|nr:CDP-alcohol phosphatidyltransferase family protein [Gemmatimonadaceae bacterium]